jgi:deoxyadenosine/deoxycytidine kinase
MIIEIIGLPGVGKTSIIKNLQQDNNFKNSSNFIGRERCVFKSKVIELSKFYMQLIFFYSKIIFDIKSSLWLLLQISRRLCNYRNNIEDRLCFLNESGVLMPIISFIVQRDKNSYKVDLDRLISTLPLPDVVIFIESDIETIVDRYANRGGILRNGIRDKVIKNAKLYERFLLGNAALLNIKKILKNKGCRVISINNNDEYEKIPSILFQKLNS